MTVVVLTMTAKGLSSEQSKDIIYFTIGRRAKGEVEKEITWKASQSFRTWVCVWDLPEVSIWAVEADWALGFCIWPEGLNALWLYSLQLHVAKYLHFNRWEPWSLVQAPFLMWKPEHSPESQIPEGTKRVSWPTLLPWAPLPSVSPSLGRYDCFLLFDPGQCKCGM